MLRACASVHNQQTHNDEGDTAGRRLLLPAAQRTYHRPRRDSLKGAENILEFGIGTRHTQTQAQHNTPFGPQGLTTRISVRIFLPALLFPPTKARRGKSCCAPLRTTPPSPARSCEPDVVSSKINQSDLHCTIYITLHCVRRRCLRSGWVRVCPGYSTYQAAWIPQVRPRERNRYS